MSHYTIINDPTVKLKEKFSFIISCVILTLLLLPASLLFASNTPASSQVPQRQPSPAENKTVDLLDTPSRYSPKAPISLLMDVTRSNDRLIAVGERGYILYSDDDGKSWKQATVPVSVTLTALSFPTAKQGWAVGHDGVVLHSIDGGENWELQLDGRRINTLMVEQLKHLITMNRNAVKSRKTTGTLNTVTEPSGDERQISDSEALENLEFLLDDAHFALEEGPARPLMDVLFQNHLKGIVVGAFGMILRTVDGGKNWTPLLDRMDNPDGFHYYGICRSETALFIAGEGGMLFRSDDHGEHWQRLTSPYDGTFFGITATPDGKRTAAFGLRGSLFISHDQGESWVQDVDLKGSSISDAVFLSDGALYLSKVDGSIMQIPAPMDRMTRLARPFPGAIALTESKDGTLVVVGIRGVACVERTPPHSITQIN